MYLGRYIRYLKYIQDDFLNVFLCPHRGAELLALSLREALEHSEEDKKKCLWVITRQLCWLFFLHPGSMALPKEMPSYRLFLSLLQTSFSFFLSLIFEFLQEKKLKTWDAPLFSLWGTNEPWMWVNQWMEVAEIAGWFFQPENKGRALVCDENMSFSWKDPSLNVIFRWGRDTLNSW